MPPDRFILSRGFAESERDAAARIYWQAFGGKLGFVLGPGWRAHSFLRRALSPDHAIVARDRSGRLVAIAGFRSAEGSLAGGREEDMRAIYGRLGALWRRGVLWLLGHEVDNHRFLIDGIAVDDDAQGCGAGTALLRALCDEARARGYDSARLEVIDRNTRARALYEREGFVATGTHRTGLLRLVFGFASATTMVRALRDNPPAVVTGSATVARLPGDTGTRLSRTLRRRGRTT